MRKLPGLTRLGLITALSLGYVAWHSHDAFAKKGGDDDSGDDDGGDDDGGGKSDDSSDDDNDEDAKDQPAVTAGGLFTMTTYPVRELSRPLTLTRGVTQLRLGIGTDVSAKGAFNTGGLSLEGAYGLSDNFTLMAGFTNAYNMRQYDFYVGFEGSLLYDVFDIRVSADLHRTAFPEYAYFCSPVAKTDHLNQDVPDPKDCGNSAMAEIVNLPDGTYHNGDAQFSIYLGFPFRYAFTPEIAIVALQTLMKIDFNSSSRDHVLPNTVDLVDAMGMPIMDSMGNQLTATRYVPVENGAKPDLIPSVGLATNPIPQLSVVAFAQLIIPDFDTSAGAFQVPVTLRLEASPSQQLDIGLAFTLLNVSPPDPQGPIDNRFVSAFVQARY